MEMVIIGGSRVGFENCGSRVMAWVGSFRGLEFGYLVLGSSESLTGLPKGNYKRQIE
jgi:hypothetical protein